MSNTKQIDEDQLANAALDPQCINHESQNHCQHLQRSLITKSNQCVIDIPILHKISICTYPHKYETQDFLTATDGYDHEKKTDITPKNCQCAICKQIPYDKLKESSTKNKKMRSAPKNDQGEKIANLSIDDLFNQLYRHTADIDNKFNEWKQNITAVHDENLMRINNENNALKEQMNNLHKKNKFSTFLMVLMGIIVCVLFIICFISYHYNSNDIRMKIEMNQRFINTETNHRFIDLEQELNRSIHFNRLQQKQLRDNLYSLNHDIKYIDIMYEKRFDAVKTQRNEQDENIEILRNIYDNHITSITEQIEDIHKLINLCFMAIFIMIELTVMIMVIKAIDKATNGEIEDNKVDRDETVKTMQSKLASGFEEELDSKHCHYEAVNIMDEEEEEKDTDLPIPRITPSYPEYATIDAKEFEEEDNKATVGDNVDKLDADNASITTRSKLDKTAIEPKRTAIDDDGLDQASATKEPAGSRNFKYKPVYTTDEEEEKDSGPQTLHQNRSDHKYTAFEEKREDNELETDSEQATLNDHEFKFYLVGTDHIDIDDILNQNGYTKPNERNIHEQMLSEVTTAAINVIDTLKTNTKMVITSQSHNLQKLTDKNKNDDNYDQPANNNDNNNNENENERDGSTDDNKTDESNKNQNNENGSGNAGNGSNNDQNNDNNNQNNDNNNKNNDENNDNNDNNDDNNDNDKNEDDDKNDEEKDEDEDDEEKDEDKNDEDAEEKDINNNNKSAHIVREIDDNSMNPRNAAPIFSKSVPNPVTTPLNANAATFTPSSMRSFHLIHHPSSKKPTLDTIKETKDSNTKQISTKQSTLLPTKQTKLINHDATSPMQYIKSQSTEKKGEASPKIRTTPTTKLSATHSEICNIPSVPNPPIMMNIYPKEITTGFNMQQSLLTYLQISDTASVYPQLNAFDMFPTLTKPVIINNKISSSVQNIEQQKTQKTQKKGEPSKTCKATTNRKESKNSRRKRKKKAANTNETTYEPHNLLRAQQHIYISKKMVEETIPGAIKEEYLNLNHFIDRYTALNYGGTEFNTENGKIKILNCDFHDKNTNDILYCKCNEFTNRGYQWILDRLMTKNQIVTEYKIAASDLPESPRTNDRLSPRSDHEKKIKDTIRNSTKIRQMIKNATWQIESDKRIPVFSKDNGSKRSMTLRLEKTKFIAQFEKFVDDNVNNVNLIPILMFQGTVFWIEYVWIIAIDGGNINIGISFKYNEINNDVDITGIHCDKNCLKQQYQLVSCNKNEVINNCLENFSSTITHLDIFGNTDIYYIDYKRKYDKIKQFVKEYVDIHTKEFNVESFCEKGREIIAK